MVRKSRSGKKLIVLILGLFIIICAVLIVKVFRPDSGTDVAPQVSSAISERVVMYRQDDALWAEDMLGDSDYTMRSSGCITSCIAAALTMQGESHTPGTLNLLLSENQCYDSEGNIQWDKVDKLDHFFAHVYSEVSSADIDSCLSAGNYPIVRIRRHGTGSYHYVLIIGTEDEEYICMDPLEDKLMQLSDHGETVYAVRCVGIE